TSLIDYDKLINWLIENKGKTVEYDFSTFVSKETMAVVSTSSVQIVPVDKNFQAVVNGENKTFRLKGSLSTGKGSVNLDPSAGKINASINILPSEDRIQ